VQEPQFVAFDERQPIAVCDVAVRTDFADDFKRSGNGSILSVLGKSYVARFRFGKLNRLRKPMG
jgi:hypothetical protein